MRCARLRSGNWRVTLLSIQGRSLKVVRKELMPELEDILSYCNPCCSICSVEFSKKEIDKYRASNLETRKTGTHVNVQEYAYTNA